MPSSDPVQRFTDIMDSIARIRRFVAGMDMVSFTSSDQTIHAVSLCPGVPWREGRGLGNRLRHEYDTIDVVRIWLLIERDLPPLAAACEEAIRILSGPPP